MSNWWEYIECIHFWEKKSVAIKIVLYIVEEDKNCSD